MDEAGETSVRRLDSFTFEKIALIKIDVEGMELSVLNGALETIKQHRPYVLLEVLDGNRCSVDAYFDNFGYYCERVDSYNYLYIPDEIE